MSELPLINLTALLLEREDMDAGVVQQLRTALAESPKQYQSLKDAVAAIERNLADGKGDRERQLLKAGVCQYFLGRMERAATHLSEVKGPLGQYYFGLALNELARYADAIKALDSAGKAGYAQTEVQLHKAAALRGTGKYEEALALLESLEDYVKGTAEYLFQYGSLLQALGRDQESIPYFEKAVESDAMHGGALFQLAFANDRNGNDEEAISLYERCLQVPPARVGTLVNLGILYEDVGDFENATFCYEQVLRVYPDHSRARLFLRDSMASRMEGFDEDAERRSDRYNAVLDIPVTDFELSVRSRNCLEKMNIRRLGDLIRCTEQQLLASKNFGETSLTEIKQMLTVKGLRLGQAAEQTPKRTHPSFNPDDYGPQQQAHFERPISDLNLSVRARKCMNRLGIGTIGDLMSHTGDELLECKNFGVTSLTEVREKLTELGLRLRGD
ncbi:DNA-directed RNA polymerase subunit alpha [Planctomycetes bacterium Pan216]|uniref:DNA-directed RNA polymerase subunit alpha n=1 Tax=Kolteria novifilia TaxID=2527975 RepID=A0A518B733_9BACT|nr:DNA-directed RNA polymerase subunit alpha [Planctomycetes bacterium Pan216]